MDRRAALLAGVVVRWRQPEDELVNPADPASAASASNHSALLALILGPGFVGLMCRMTWGLRLAA